MPLALVTGTSGMVGAAMAGALAGRFDVVAINRRSPVASATELAWDFRSNLPSEMPVHADLVLHAAATDGRGATEPDRECFDCNVGSTARLLQYAQRAGVKQFVYISSGSVYALAPHAARETDVLGPEGHYAASKAAAEAVVAGYAATMETLVLRLFYPYGPQQRSGKLIPALIAKLAACEPITLNGALGRPAVNPLHIDDVAELARRLVDGAARGTYNIGGTETITIRSLAERIAGFVGESPRFVVGPECDGDRLGDVTRLMQATGYAPRIDLDAGLATMPGLNQAK